MLHAAKFEQLNAFSNINAREKMSCLFKFYFTVKIYVHISIRNYKIYIFFLIAILFFKVLHLYFKLL